jgi:alcohol dehydrogenase class IV
MAHVMHGVTSAILLSPVLRYMAPRRVEVQNEIVKTFNTALGWHEDQAADCMEKFVKSLGLPTRLSEVGVTTDLQIKEIGQMTMTDIWGSEGPQLEEEEIVTILKMAR